MLTGLLPPQHHSRAQVDHRRQVQSVLPGAKRTPGGAGVEDAFAVAPIQQPWSMDGGPLPRSRLHGPPTLGARDLPDRSVSRRGVRTGELPSELPSDAPGPATAFVGPEHLAHPDRERVAVGGSRRRGPRSELGERGTRQGEQVTHEQDAVGAIHPAG